MIIDPHYLIYRYYYKRKYYIIKMFNYDHVLNYMDKFKEDGKTLVIKVNGKSRLDITEGIYK